MYKIQITDIDSPITEGYAEVFECDRIEVITTSKRKIDGSSKAFVKIYGEIDIQSEEKGHADAR